MTKEDFLQLQSDYQASDLSLKLYLKQKGTYYTTYNYWRRKYRSQVDVMHDLAPISILRKEQASLTFSYDVASGATLLFPNG